MSDAISKKLPTQINPDMTIALGTTSVVNNLLTPLHIILTIAILRRVPRLQKYLKVSHKPINS